MNPLSHRKQIILPLLVTVVLGCFALPSATQAVPLPSNVNVVNTPNVNVVNPTTQPVPVRDVDNPARQPFQVQVVGDFADGASTTGDIPITTVPAGKLLVIEYVSLFGSMLTGQQLVRARLQTGNPPVYSELRFNIQGGNVEVTRDYLRIITFIQGYGLTGAENDRKYPLSWRNYRSMDIYLRHHRVCSTNYNGNST